MKNQKRTDSLTQKRPQGKLTREQSELLADLHNIRLLLPAIHNVIRILELPISKQAIHKRAQRKLRNYGK